MLKSGFIIEMNLGEENKRYATLSQTHHLQMTEMRSRIPGIQNCTSLLEIGTSFVGKLHAPLCTSMEAVKDLSLHSESSQKPFTAGESKPENRTGAMAPLRLWVKRQSTAATLRCLSRPLPAWLRSAKKMRASSAT